MTFKCLALCLMLTVGLQTQSSKEIGPLQFSVVLPCADEGEFAAKTVVKMYERTPKDVLKEIIVVDDGSETPIGDVLSKFGIKGRNRTVMKVKLITHDDMLGLMAAKRTGGDAASGDVIVFFDCHVSPKSGWTVEIARLIAENPKRMVVPAITDLDIDTWEEAANTAVNTKCYLTWQGDFKWYDSGDHYVPIMSGGMLALSRSWWSDTGGYDEHMRGWGGENIDQSLRSWLCGGEIVRAPSSRVAHMWRTEDPRTKAVWREGSSDVPAKQQMNRLRAVSAWFDVFREKAGQFFNVDHPGLDISNLKKVRKRLKCKPFVFFLWRFRDIYVEAGMLPPKVFSFWEKKSDLCVTSDPYRKILELTKCKKDNPMQLFNWGNQKQEDKKCCSGLRLWFSGDCVDHVDAEGPHSYACDISGRNLNQRWKLLPDHKLLHQADYGDDCLESVRNRKAKSGWSLQHMSCVQTTARFRERWPFEPLETRLYRQQMVKHSASLGLLSESTSKNEL